MACRNTTQPRGIQVQPRCCPPPRDVYVIGKMDPLGGGPWQLIVLDFGLGSSFGPKKIADLAPIGAYAHGLAYVAAEDAFYFLAALGKNELWTVKPDGSGLRKIGVLTALPSWSAVTFFGPVTNNVTGELFVYTGRDGGGVHRWGIIDKTSAALNVLANAGVGMGSSVITGPITIRPSDQVLFVRGSPFGTYTLFWGAALNAARTTLTWYEWVRHPDFIGDNSFTQGDFDDPRDVWWTTAGMPASKLRLPESAMGHAAPGVSFPITPWPGAGPGDFPNYSVGIEWRY